METKRSSYPSSLVDNPLQAVIQRHKDRAKQNYDQIYQNYKKYPKTSRTCLQWQALRCIKISPEAQFDGNKWVYGSNIGSIQGYDVEERDQEIVGGYEYASAFDIDIEDGAGILFQVRVAYNSGSADANTGIFGKAFERNSVIEHPDKPIVLAEILSFGDSCTKIECTNFIKEKFVPHKGALEDLFNYLKVQDEEGYESQAEDMLPGYFRDQFSFLLGMALFEPDQYAPETVPIVDGTSLQQKLLKEVVEQCKEGENSLGTQVFSIANCRDLIGDYSAERYIYGEGDKDTSFDWYARIIIHFVRALRFAEKKDVKGAYDATDKFCQDRGEERWIWQNAGYDHWEEFKNEVRGENREVDLEKTLEKLNEWRALALGWEKDDALVGLLESRLEEQINQKYDSDSD